MKSSLNPLAAAFPATGSSEDLTNWAGRFARNASGSALVNSRSSSQTAMSPMSPDPALLQDDPFGMANSEGAGRLQRQLSLQSLADPDEVQSETKSSVRRRKSKADTSAANTKHSAQSKEVPIAAPSGKEGALPAATDPSLGPILEAARSGFLTPLVAFPDLRLNPHATDERGYPALYLVASMEHGPRVMDLLLQHGAQLEATAPGGNTPLMLAVKNNQDKAAVNLLVRHAGLFTVARYRRTPDATTR